MSHAMPGLHEEAHHVMSACALANLCSFGHKCAAGMSHASAQKNSQSCVFCAASANIKAYDTTNQKR